MLNFWKKLNLSEQKKRYAYHHRQSAVVVGFYYDDYPICLRLLEAAGGKCKLIIV